MVIKPSIDVVHSNPNLSSISGVKRENEAPMQYRMNMRAPSIDAQ
jgi:hypothetical protein